MFPARAGMSRHLDGRAGALGYVPRASGDEPLSIRVYPDTSRCSPRERG